MTQNEFNTMFANALKANGLATPGPVILDSTGHITTPAPAPAPAPKARKQAAPKQAAPKQAAPEKTSTSARATMQVHADGTFTITGQMPASWEPSKSGKSVTAHVFAPSVEVSNGRLGLSATLWFKTGK